MKKTFIAMAFLAGMGMAAVCSPRSTQRTSRFVELRRKAALIRQASTMPAPPMTH